jgi:hypothetical protein
LGSGVRPSDLGAWVLVLQTWEYPGPGFREEQSQHKANGIGRGLLGSSTIATRTWAEFDVGLFRVGILTPKLQIKELISC